VNQLPDDSAKKIKRSAERLRDSRSHPPTSPLLGLGSFGMIGWTIATPTVGGALIGLWLDERIPQTFSWALALLFAGITLGGFMALGWMIRENPGQKPPEDNNV